MEHNEIGGRVRRMPRKSRTCLGVLLAAIFAFPCTTAAWSWGCQSQSNASCNPLTGGCCGTLVCDPFAGFKCHHVPAHAGELCTLPTLGCEDSHEYYCKGFQEGIAGRCVEYAKVGERCDFVHTLCRNPLEGFYSANRGCFPELDLEGWEVTDAFVCYPSMDFGLDLVRYGFDPDDPDECENAWSKSVHEEVIATGKTRSYSSGAVGYLGLTGAIEWGVVYGEDGSYACFRETCVGAMTNLGAGSYSNYGVYDSYSDFVGATSKLEAGAGYYLGLSVGWAYDEDMVQVGRVASLGVSFDLLPISGDLLACTTTPLNEYTYVPGGSPELVPKAAPIPLVCRNTTACADSGTCVANASISGSPGGEPVPVVQEPVGPYAIGRREVSLVPEVQGQATSCTALVEVFDCDPPAIQCPMPVTAECQAGGASTVVLATPIVSDCSPYVVDPPDGDSYPLGTTSVTFVATDTMGNGATCETTVTVADTQPPRVVSAIATPSILWPPNHEMWNVRIDVVAVDTCDPAATCKVSGITSSEPADDRGDGHTDVVDFEITGDTSVALRAERMGTGVGRLYAIGLECRDSSGNVSHASASVSVPHEWAYAP